MTRSLLASAAVAALAVPALAQGGATVAVGQSDQYGSHLVDGDGRALYLFTTDTQGTADAEAQLSCTSEGCLQAWPPFPTQGEPQAGEGANADMLGTTEFEGQTVVTYNGWPLYHFARDAGAGEATGQEIESFGGEWYLVTPEGKELHAE